MNKSPFDLAAFLSYIVLGSAAVLLFWVIWSLMWPFDPLWVSNDGFVPVKSHFKRGERLMVRVKYCHRWNVQAQMDTSIEQDNRLLFMLPQWPTPKVGCHTIVFPLLTIPRTLALESTTAAGNGEARARVAFKFQANPLRTVDYQYTTPIFYIDP